MILLFILFIKNLYFIIGAQLCTLTCSYHIDRGGLIVAVDKNFIIIIIIINMVCGESRKNMSFGVTPVAECGVSR